MALDLFHRIVVPTDFSECAEAAWALAKRVAGSLGSEVVLTHVLVEPVVYGDPSIAADTTRELFEQGRKWVEDEIEKWASAARAEGITVRTIVRTGSAQEEIVNLATDERADLIIIGTHGRTGLNRLLLGSIADRVIRFSPCPVLTVRTPANG
jgi:nucleotide-binding universal stress UspA family protein